MPQALRVADMTPSQLRSTIQSGVMIGLIAAYVMMSLVGVVLYVLLH